MRHVHNTGNNSQRMLRILKRDGQDKWLTGSVDDAGSALAQYNPTLMLAHEVTTRVNTPKNYGTALDRGNMTTPLDKTLKRALNIKGRDYVVSLSPDSLKITLKGRRLGIELRWSDLVDGEAALATALNASLGKFAADALPVPTKKKRLAKTKR